jgi:NAD(P)-dependent dehydrogenase (short-subunit alcohol dehydrogenase family)
MKLKEKVALITGGGRGIGREIALLFASEGAKVAVTARSSNQLSDVVNDIVGEGGNAIGVTGDVSRQEDVTKMVEETTKNFGRIDILVNNAGIMQGAPFVAFEPEDWRRVIEVNLMGTFYCTKFIAPMLIEQGWGRIINMASRSGKIGIPYLTAYVASKHGVVGFTKALAEELAPFNITVNAICPGTVETDMVPATVKERIGELLIPPSHVADLALYLATENAASINGEAINIYGRTKLDLSM